MQGKFPTQTIYEEYACTLAVGSKPFGIGGTRGFVQLMSSSDLTDVTEFSLDQGSSWTKLRKGLCIKFPQETTGLMLRNAVGADVVIATGVGGFDDRRLVIDPTSGTIPVDVLQDSGGFLAGIRSRLPAAFDTGALKVREQRPVAVVGAGAVASYHANNLGAGTDVILAAGGNLAGLRIIMAAVLSSPASFLEHAELEAVGPGGTILLASGRSVYGTQLGSPIIIPAGYALQGTSTSAADNVAYCISWEVLT